MLHLKREWTLINFTNTPSVYDSYDSLSDHHLTLLATNVAVSSILH